MVDEPTERDSAQATPPESAKRVRRTGVSRRRTGVLTLAGVIVGAWIAIAYGACGSSEATRIAGPRALPASDMMLIQEPTGDFSAFSHANAMHSRLPCLLCHHRDDAGTRPQLPGHMPCAGCHAKQFANSASPICSICHTDTSSGAVKQFPRLRSFDVAFDHSTHVRAAGGSRAACASCHKPSRGGVALSIPSGEAAHATCFRCHSPRSQAEGRDISSCGVCHREGTPSKMAAAASVAFTRSFDHSRHGEAGLACAECHSVRSGASAAKQVTSPVPEMHHAPAGARSCASCHDGARAFGGTDFTACARCHQGDAWRF